MKFVEIFAQLLYVALAVVGGYLIAEGVTDSSLRAELVVLIPLTVLLWSLPLYAQRSAILELSQRGYSVTRLRGWLFDEWSATKPGYVTFGYHSASELLKAVRDHDYRREIIEEHEQRKAQGLAD